uniref:Uncharacterized protein n=1 Tax=Timema genevievae TaxID=629358 RepID=A0A7R9JUE4_TIMGE|nr:unnamed protein product [Timema genevievae]
MGTREFSWEDDPRRIVNDGRAILERTGESLARSHHTAIETEEIGTAVISELGDQRETLLRTKQRLAETNEGLSRSHIIMRKMAWNVLYNKLILVLIILLELGILAAVVYLKFFKK